MKDKAKPMYMLAPGCSVAHIARHLNENIIKDFPEYELFQILVIKEMVEVNKFMSNAAGPSFIDMAYPLLKRAGSSTDDQKNP